MTVPRFIEPLETRIAPAYIAVLTFLPGTNNPSVSFTGDAAGDELELSIGLDGLLEHNRFAAGDAGFASRFDLDSSAQGVQSFNASGLNSLTVNAGGGDDTLIIEDGVGLGTFDGEDGSDSYKIHTGDAREAAAYKISDSGKSGADKFELMGTDAPDMFSLKTGTRGIMMPPGSTIVVDFTGMEEFTASTGAGEDTIIVESVNAAPKWKFDGGDEADAYTIKFDGLASELEIFDSSSKPGESDLLTLIGIDGDDSIVGIKGEISDFAQKLKYTPSGPGAIEELKIITGGGNDAIWFKHSDISLVEVLGGAGTDSHKLDASSAGTLHKWDGQDGSDDFHIKFDGVDGVVEVHDSGKPVAGDADRLEILGTEGDDVILAQPDGVMIKGELHLKYGAAGGEFEEWKFSAGGGNDKVSMQDFHFPSALADGGAGNDSFSVFSSGLKFEGDPTHIKFDGREGSDSYEIKWGGLIGLVEIADSSTPAAGEKDTLQILGSSGDESFVLKGDDIFSHKQDLKISVAGSGLEEHKLDAGAGDDVVEVDLFRILIGLLVGGQGDDELSVLGTAAQSGIKWDGQEGSDATEIKLGALAGAVQIADSGKSPGNSDTVMILGTESDDSIIFHKETITGHKLSDPKAAKEIISHKGGFELLGASGGGGNDRIEAAAFSSSGGLTLLKLDGAAGDDTIIGSRFADVLLGGPGADKLMGGAGPDSLTGGPDDDRLIGGGGLDTVIEAGDADWIVSNFKWTTGAADGAVHKMTGAGSDLLSGINLLNITGGDGSNRMSAGKFAGSVMFDGAAGDDVLIGGRSADVFIGGPGSDRISGGGGRDEVRETGDFSYKLIGDGFTSTLETFVPLIAEVAAFGVAHLCPEMDILSRIARVSLTGGASGNVMDASEFEGQVVMFGLGGDDILRGGTGNDFFTGGDGDDIIIGGGGADSLVEASDIFLKISDVKMEGLGTDALEGIKFAILTGGDGDDEIDASGFSGPVTLIGLGGNDKLIGGMGSSILIGGDGDDTLVGGKGKNVFKGGPGRNVIQHK